VAFFIPGTRLVGVLMVTNSSAAVGWIPTCIPLKEKEKKHKKESLRMRLRAQMCSGQRQSNQLRERARKALAQTQQVRFVTLTSVMHIQYSTVV